MKMNFKHIAISAAAMLLITGCSYKATTTPAVMTYDGSKVDYSKVENMKSAKVCIVLADGEGDTTVTQAAKAAGISKIKHVDTSFEYKKFIIFPYAHKKCVTVYGE